MIENSGIFAATAADTTAVEASRIYERRGFRSLRHKNYLSFYESVDLAQADLDQSVGLGFVEKFGSLEEVQAKFSEDVRVTRIACLSKLANRQRSATMRERVVLPRVADIASRADDLLEGWAVHCRLVTSLFCWSMNGSMLTIKGLAIAMFSAVSRLGSPRVHS